MKIPLVLPVLGYICLKNTTIRVPNIPTYNICGLSDEPGSSSDFMADRFEAYLAAHTHLKFPHRHSFFHLVYFSDVAGSHSIDFVDFDAKPGQIYFMNPGQVHSWNFMGLPKGYIINFSEAFLQQFLSNTRYLDQFGFFNSLPEKQVVSIPAEKQPPILGIFQAILDESYLADEFSQDKIRTLLLQLLYGVSRTVPKEKITTLNNYNSLLFKNFQALIDQHFLSKKLVRDYAAMLYVTPNHLNALSKDVAGRSAGELIRDRILLEAKRMLINEHYNISEIAYSLNFEDNSYFTKFFKKYEGLTPQDFRKRAIAS